MKRRFPKGFLKCFLVEGKVSCFLGAESHREFRKLSTKPLDSSGSQRFPASDMVFIRGNQEFPGGFLGGFLLGVRECL